MASLRSVQTPRAIERGAIFGAQRIKITPPPCSRIDQASVKTHVGVNLAEIADTAPQVAAAGSAVADQANNLAPGSVSAPTWVIPVALVVVTVGSILSGYLLKPGTDAAEKVFQRDAKRIGNQARAKAKGLKR